MDNTSTVGNRSMGQVLSGLLRQRKLVLLPFGDGHRYDLAFDENGLQRVQCKTGRLIRGSVQFPLASKSNVTGIRKVYEGEVEFFGVYCPALDKTYLVPVSVVAGLKTEGSLRVEPTKNSQVKRIRLAEQYEI